MVSFWTMGVGLVILQKKFLADGFKVNAFDASEKMIEIASIETQVDWWVADFKSFHATDKYDGIWANFSLLHASKKRFHTINSNHIQKSEA